MLGFGELIGEAMLKSRLKKLIWDRWSQEQFALEAGLHPSTVGALCRNTFSRVDAVTVVKVCRTLGIGIGELFYIEGEGEGDNA